MTNLDSILKSRDITLPTKIHLIKAMVFLVVVYGCEFSSVQSLSHVQLCDPMNCSMPGFPVHHQLPEFTQTHVHRVGDAIQPSHPLSSPSPLAPQSLPASESFPTSHLFASGGRRVGASTSASVLPMNIHD